MYSIGQTTPSKLTSILPGQEALSDMNSFGAMQSMVPLLPAMLYFLLSLDGNSLDPEATCNVEISSANMTRFHSYTFTMHGAYNLCSPRWKTTSASSAPTAPYYPNYNACSTAGEHYRRMRGLWTSIRSSDLPCPRQAAALSPLRTLPPKTQLPWGPQVAPSGNQSRKHYGRTDPGRQTGTLAICHAGALATSPAVATTGRQLQ